MSAVPNSEAPRSASVEVLTAEVRVVMVGNRQITLSVYKQLDRAEPEEIDAWGRVRSGAKDLEPGEIELIGRRKDTGDLARSTLERPSMSNKRTIFLHPFSDFFVMGKFFNGTWPNEYQYDHEQVDEQGRRGGKLYRQREAVRRAAPDHVRVYSRDPYTVYASIPSTFDVDPTLPEGAIRYRNEQAEAEVLQRAKDDVEWEQDLRDEYQKVSALPLIVLAGLR